MMPRRDRALGDFTGGTLRAACLIAGLMATDRADAADSPAAVPPISQILLEDLSTMRERPLFSPSRRPPPEAQVAVVAPPPPPPPQPQPATPPPNLLFFGTFESANEIGATIQVIPGEKPAIVRFGSYINGWRVVEISRLRLVLALNEQTAVFSLFDPRSPAQQSATGTPPTLQAPIQRGGAAGNPTPPR
jgi:hypothetical protein